MYEELLGEIGFYRLLLRFDEDLAAATRVLATATHRGIEPHPEVVCGIRLCTASIGGARTTLPLQCLSRRLTELQVAVSVGEGAAALLFGSPGGQESNFVFMINEKPIGSARREVVFPSELKLFADGFCNVYAIDKSAMTTFPP